MKYSIVRRLGDRSNPITDLVRAGQCLYVRKQYRFTDNNTWSGLNRIGREYAAMKLLPNEHIPKVYDYIETDRSIEVISEYIEGPNLAQVPLSIAEVFEKVQILLEILDLIHKRGIIHRDIKPENIVLSIKNNRLYLIDFELARGVGAGTLVGTECLGGTFGYMPPECLAGKSYPMSDLYSLGATVFALLVRESNLEKYLSADARLQLNWLKGEISDEWIEWIRKCTLPDPRKRYRSAREALVELKEISYEPRRKTKPPQIKLEKKEAIETRRSEYELLGEFLYSILLIGVGLSIAPDLEGWLVGISAFFDILVKLVSLVGPAMAEATGDALSWFLSVLTHLVVAWLMLSIGHTGLDVLRSRLKMEDLLWRFGTCLPFLFWEVFFRFLSFLLAEGYYNDAVTF